MDLDAENATVTDIENTLTVTNAEYTAMNVNI